MSIRLPRFAKRHDRCHRPMLESMEPRVLLSSGPVWVIRGDADRNAPDDHIVIEIDANDPATLVATVNGQVVDTHDNLDRLRNLRVLGRRGNDHISINLEGLNKHIRTFLNGGPGNDKLEGSFTHDVLIGGPGDDTLMGGAGNDRATGSVGVDMIMGDAGNDRLIGGGHNDQIVGGDGDDFIIGGGGDDDIVGGFGNDRILGGGGADNIRGDEGADDIAGGGGIDNLIVNTILDKLRGARRDNTIEDDSEDRSLEQIPTGQGLVVFFIDAAVDRWEHQLGQKVDHVWPWIGWRGGVIDIVPDIAFTTVADRIVTGQANDAAGAPVFIDGLAGTTTAESAGSGGVLASTDFEDTNVQVTGVDEADVVKTDGSYLYLIDGGHVKIIDANPDSGLATVSTLELAGAPHGLYLNGDTLTVITHDEFFLPFDHLAPTGLVADIIAPDWWREYDPSVTVTHYDVSDAAEPKMVESNTIDGTLLATRRIGDDTFLVVSNVVDLPAPQIVETDDGGLRYSTEAEYRAQLAEALDDQTFPQVTSTSADGTSETGDLITGDSVYVAPDMDGQNLVSIMRIDVTDGNAGVDASFTAMGLRGTIYASADNMFFAAQAWQRPTDFWGGASRTDIFKFSLGETIEAEGVGSVPGWVRNSFSMDEHDGHLRVATTDFNDELANSVFVLKDTGDNLEIVGEVTGLAPGQRIFSARFVGDRGYVVTFRRVDPLHVIDLSDPTDPFEAGFLEIEGVSTYLQPVGDTHLIGFGRDADDRGRFQGLKMTLFDVTDASNPTEVSTLLFDQDHDYSYSEAEWNHLAFNYFASRETAAFPIGGGNYGEATFGLAVIDVDTVAGLTEVGRVVHKQPVRRSVRIDDWLYSVGNDALRLVPIDDPSDVLAETELEGEFHFPVFIQ